MPFRVDHVLRDVRIPMPVGGLENAGIPNGCSSHLGVVLDGKMAAEGGPVAKIEQGLGGRGGERREEEHK